MKLIKNPWNNLFYNLVSTSKSSIKITSPFVKYDVVNMLFNSKLANTKLSLITSFKLMNYYTRVSDLTALELILNNKGYVRNFQKLHSKIFIFDDKTAIVTSSNLTNGGLVRNYEYGVLVDEENIVNNIISDFEDLFTNELTGKITIEEVNSAKDIISKVPTSRSIILPEIELKNDVEDFEIYTGGVDSIISSLKGWKLEVFKCLLEIPRNSFTLKDLNKYVSGLKQIFPRNHNIEAKIRQQLQNLRDIGLIQFLGKGSYKKLWK